MGHSINYFTCENAEINKALKRYLATAYDPQESCGYHGNMTVHKDIICKNREEAEKMIQRLDRGWYDDNAALDQVCDKMAQSFREEEDY